MEHDAQLIQLGREQRELRPPAALVAVVTTPKRMALVLDLPILYTAPDNIVRQALRPLFQARPAQAAAMSQTCIFSRIPDEQGPLVYCSMLNTQLASLASLFCTHALDGRLCSLSRQGCPCLPLCCRPFLHMQLPGQPAPQAGGGAINCTYQSKDDTSRCAASKCCV